MAHPQNQTSRRPLFNKTASGQSSINFFHGKCTLNKIASLCKWLLRTGQGQDFKCLWFIRIHSHRQRVWWASGCDCLVFQVEKMKRGNRMPYSHNSAEMWAIQKWSNGIRCIGDDGAIKIHPTVCIVLCWWCCVCDASEEYITMGHSKPCGGYWADPFKVPRTIVWFWCCCGTLTLASFLEREA